MATRKGVGGPKTDSGKAVSSKNALKLGMNTMNIHGADEKQLVDEYVSELSNYYQPQSPLEKLQIQRIAICRAKLARLYQVEQVRLELSQNNIENSPDQILQEMGVGKGLLRTMALEGIRHGAITLPCDLSEKTLGVIVKEVDHFHGTLKTEQDIQVSLPQLAKFLSQYTASGLKQSSALSEKFEVVMRRIHKAMRHDVYFGILGQFFEDLFSVRSNQTSEDEDGAISLMKELNPEYVPPEPAEQVINLQQLQGLLPLFVYLQKALYDAKSLIERYHAAKTLLVNSVMLPQAEADLLMRYQTTLERRLSNSIGELLELQKRR